MQLGSINRHRINTLQLDRLTPPAGLFMFLPEILARQFAWYGMYWSLNNL